MQHGKQINSESRLDSLVKERINDLKFKLYVKEFERLNLCEGYFTDTFKNYIAEEKHFLYFIIQLRDLNRIVNNICSQLLNIKVKVTQGSEAFFAALLQNMLDHKKITHDFLIHILKPCEDLKEGFAKLENMSSQSSGDFISVEFMTVSHSLLTELRKQVAKVNEMVSLSHEKFFHLLCTIEETLEKIQLVLERL